MSITIKGMVQYEGVTYRIVRLARGSYSVVRIQDDMEVGKFATQPQLRVSDEKIKLDELREIVKFAIRSARTSAVVRLP
ncbi:MAG TPA: hypothetical protein VGM29_19245 [Polyangiaceae bacterium]|jgi:hypothetical protein